MRTLLFTMLFLVGASTGNANEKLYNKLNKLYLTNRDKCAEMTKKVLKKDKTASIPYYFNSIIYYDKSKESQTLRGTYLQLYRSVTSAVKFEKYSNEKDRKLVQWDEHLLSLKNRADRLIAALNRNAMGDLSLKLEEGLSEVGSFSELYKTEIDDDLLAKTPDETPKSTKTPTNYVRKPGHFYGLPTGTEIIQSSDESVERKLLELINIERGNRRIPALKWSETLANASRYHAYDQGTQGYFSHATSDDINGETIIVGSTFDRIKKFHRGNVAGECIAAGNASAEQTFAQWLKSSAHANIILDHDATIAGIGYIQVPGSPYEYYWVIVTGN
ncbi:MAG TPA: CAP domain-containing protein [Taishania sp.]|nr:CAP domain-containing protein [Taishania sp.]